MINNRTTNITQYPKYKPAGIQWLENIPDHWEIEKGKRILHKMERPVSDEDEVVTCFRDGMVTLRKNRRTEGFTEALQETGYQGIRNGDLVIHQMDAFAGAIGVSDSDGKGTPVYTVCIPAAEANAHYYALIVREMARSQWVLALAKGIRERSTDFRYATLSRENLPLPPLKEQAAIVRYLDAADQKIQAYISAKEKLIALLEEQRQTIIHQAVTRGLDPNVKLKPSGVEWLGDVPEHWEVTAAKRKYIIQMGKMLQPSPKTEDDKEVQYLRALNIQWESLVTHDIATMWANSSEIAQLQVQPTDLLVCEEGRGQEIRLL